MSCARLVWSGEMSRFEQVPGGPAAVRVAPPGPAVLGRVVQHVAALAERGEVARPIATRIVAEMAACQDHPGNRQAGNGTEAVQAWLPCLERIGRGQAAHSPAAPVAPTTALGVPPPPVAQVDHRPAVWPPTTLARALRTLEPDMARDLGPIDRVKPTGLRRNRHEAKSESGHERGEGSSPRHNCRVVVRW